MHHIKNVGVSAHSAMGLGCGEDETVFVGRGCDGVLDDDTGQDLPLLCAAAGFAFTAEDLGEHERGTPLVGIAAAALLSLPLWGTLAGAGWLVLG